MFAATDRLASRSADLVLLRAFCLGGYFSLMAG